MRRFEIWMAAAMALAAAACSGRSADAPATPLQPVAVTPYTRVTHALRGDVAEVTTKVYSDTGLVSADYRRYRPDGRLEAEAASVGGYAADTLLIVYAPDGRIVLDDSASMTAIYDDAGRLIRLESHAEPPLVIVYGYDRLGRLTAEATAPAEAYPAGDGWLSSVEYQYDGDALMRVTRVSADGYSAVTDLDAQGAPVTETVYDSTGRPLRRCLYQVTARDSLGNWTSATAAPPHRRLHRHLRYY